ncbi:ribonuclease P protein subunit p25-like protein-like [Hibiscus syriacus]|uniref:Ribonuclease P protein subunit p25-like protein-like n=1 Tax=Hibiscus syriacus TaxID=106335 RepID=A0A6A3AAD4_HIBSY|nr:RNA-binding protein 39-like [Hibiscus syriacus]KAE8700105.1 ribonuclease P protein subunit p25-like protein-like [Hibiscus syriacus]
MNFDEYEYLEKTVEEQEDPKKKDGVSGDKSEISYRKRGERKEDDDEIKSSRKKLRGSRDEDDEERRDRDKERHRSSRDREREKDRDLESSREREKERGRDRRDRDKEKEKDRERREGERRERSSSKSRRHEREEERERERRERSSSKSRRHEREEEREMERRERSSSRSRRHESDRERDRVREIGTRDSRRFKDKKEVVEPEADPERDQRTVFAYQMPLKATERDVYEFFSKAGKVRDVRLIMDRNSRRSKGVGYIEFYDVMSVPMAIALSGQLLLGQPVMVKPSEAEKNLVQSNASGAGAGSVAGPYGAVDRKLYVGNLHFNMTEMQLRQIFEPFGPVELVQLPLDLETGQCKGFGFVQFAQLEHAKAAQDALNGKLEIAGRTIKVSSVTDHVGTQDPAAKSADFDDDEGGGLALNAQSRALLMQKLDRSGIATSITSSLGVPLLNGSAPNPQAVMLPVNGQAAYPSPVLPPIMCATPLDPIGQPSECLLLKNMFDPATETEPDFDMEIKDDVEEECSKYGRVKHIYVDKNSAGHVYLRFDSVEAAGKAQRAMHMRWFAGRSISALFMPPHEYEARFKG